MAHEIDDGTVYQLGSLVVVYILLDQALTELWIDLEELEEDDLGSRDKFMSKPFNKKVASLKKRIATGRRSSYAQTVSILVSAIIPLLLYSSLTHNTAPA